MKSENEKDFLKHFEKYLDSMNKQGKIYDELSTIIAVNNELNIKIVKNIKRLFPRKTMLLELGRSMLNNVKKMELTSPKEHSCLDSQIKIITDMKNIATKIINEDKKEMIMKIVSLLEERVYLIRELIDTSAEYAGISGILGESAIKCGKGSMEFSVAFKEFNPVIEVLNKKINEVKEELDVLQNETSDLRAKLDNIGTYK